MLGNYIDNNMSSDSTPLVREEFLQLMKRVKTLEKIRDEAQDLKRRQDAFHKDMREIHGETLRKFLDNPAEVVINMCLKGTFDAMMELGKKHGLDDWSLT